MKLILDIDESREEFFLELLQSLDYVTVLKAVKDKKKSKNIKDLVEAFNDVRQHEKGIKKLQSAKDLLDDL